MTAKIIIGDCREVLKTLPDESVHCVVTSPPYFGLRDYGMDGQLGQEPTPADFVAVMVEVFREVRRVLRADGTLWLNLGDSYNSQPSWGRGGGSTLDGRKQGNEGGSSVKRAASGLKPKDLIGIPWMVATALRAPYYTGRIKRLEDRIWLAAMIDGEGCMFIHKRKVGQNNGQGYERKSDSYGSGLEVANCHRAIVDRCQQITGVGSICEQSKDRRQTLYRWNVRSNECRWIIEEIYPHLVGKQHQARLLLGCPSSGETADLAHRGLIDLHGGLTPAIDFPAPKPLYEAGWYLRQDCIWSKLNPMPESVTDRCTKAHEYLFMLTKSSQYRYDAEAIAEPAIYSGLANQDDSGFKDPRSFNGKHKAGYRTADRDVGVGSNARPSKAVPNDLPRTTRNKRSVWEVATAPFSEAHFATFPPALIEPCIKAGCPVGGTVLDPFGGAGTTGLVADRLGRNSILIELNPEYAAMAERRIRNDAPLFAQVAAE